MITLLKVLEASKGGTQQATGSENGISEDSQSSESITAGYSSSSGPSQDNDETSDTFLKLGYVQMHLITSFPYFVFWDFWKSLRFKFLLLRFGLKYGILLSYVANTKILAVSFYK